MTGGRNASVRPAGGKGTGGVEPMDEDRQSGGERSQDSPEGKRRNHHSPGKGESAGWGRGAGGANRGISGSRRPGSVSPERRSLPPKKDIQRRDSPPVAEA